MSKRTIATVCAALGLGLVITLTSATAVSAGPTSMHGLTQHIVTVRTVAVPDNTTEVQASCDPGDLMTGGGYTIGSIGFSDKVFVNAPLNDHTWSVEAYNDTVYNIDLWAYAICLSSAH